MDTDDPAERSSTEKPDPTREGFWTFIHGMHSNGTGPGDLFDNEFVQEVLGKDLGYGLVNSLNRTAIAEPMLEDAMRQHPECAALLNGQLKTLEWWIPRRVSEMLYRDHVLELLQRVVEGQAVKPATRAEVLTLLCDLAKRDLLNRQTEAVFGCLFSEVTRLRYPAILQMIELQSDVERNSTLADLREQLRAPCRELQPALPRESRS